MYLAAQRVRSTGRTGVNVFLYRHPPGSIAWADPGHVVEQMPGELVSSEIEVPPGGNEVLSFLDVVAAEEVSSDAVVDLVDQLREEALRDGVAGAEGVGVRFSATGALTARAAQEWQELVHRAFRLLLHPTPLAWRSGEGLVITREANAERYLFTLTPKSLSKLREMLGQEWSAPKVTVAHATMDDLGLAGFDAYEQIATAMTGYRLDELLPLGRIRVADPRGTLLWEWPATNQGVGYCLTCHRQHTLVAAKGAYKCANCGSEQEGDGRFVGALI